MRPTVRPLAAALGAALLLAACGGSDAGGTGLGTASGATCPAGSTLTYATFGQTFFATHCLTCHSSTLSGVARSGAPVGVNFDTAALIRGQRTRIDAMAASGPSRTNALMPPTGGVTLTERQQLGEWLACNAPE